MKSFIKAFISLVMVLALFACSKEELALDPGVPTILEGRVSDNLRGQNISNYKIVLVKSWSSCSNWMCGIDSREVATAYTDADGYYKIEFD